MEFTGSVIIVLLMIITVDAKYKWLPLNPDETLFTYTRCMEDHFYDFDLLSKWINWELPKEDDKTPCYVKCVLEGMELFDPETRKFKPENVKTQHQRYKMYTNATDREARKLQNALARADIVTEDECTAVFNSYIKVHSIHGEAVRKIFLGHTDVVNEIRANDSSFKPQNESVFRFCLRKHVSESDPEKCNIRRDLLPEKPENYPDYFDCLLRGLRYIDRNGNINPAEVKRDLHQIGVYDKDSEVDTAIENCESDALSYYRCLLENEFALSMIYALEYREIRSMDYYYNLIRIIPVYSNERTREQVNRLTEEAGCEST